MGATISKIANSDKPRKQTIRVCQNVKRKFRKSTNGKHAKSIKRKTHKSDIPRKRENENANNRKDNKSKSKHAEFDTTIQHKIEIAKFVDKRERWMRNRKETDDGYWRDEGPRRWCRVYRHDTSGLDLGPGPIFAE